jgi:beta-galactosidase
VFFKAKLHLDNMGDSYIDMSAWDQGYLWVNGNLLGRYWKIGPQQRLYCPASWLHKGDNELLVFDLHRVESAPIKGVERLSDG